MNKKTLAEATANFQNLIKNSKDDEIVEHYKGCWIAAWKWAEWFVKSDEDPETYRAVYLIYYSYFVSLDYFLKYLKQCD